MFDTKDSTLKEWPNSVNSTKKYIVYEAKTVTLVKILDYQDQDINMKLKSIHSSQLKLCKILVGKTRHASDGSDCNHKQ